MNKRRRMVGVVTSNKMTKSVAVKIAHSYRHPLYKKVIHTSRVILAHDEIGCEVGDQVQLVESRPISKRISWVIEKILKKEEKTVTVDASVDIVPARAETPQEEQPITAVVDVDEQSTTAGEKAGEPA
ncbi:MAG: 30S ribosomal protein S17 [Anaerolineaceae bacterium]